MALASPTPACGHNILGMIHVKVLVDPVTKAISEAYELECMECGEVFPDFSALRKPEAPHA